MRLNIVSLRSGTSAAESSFVGSGFLVDAHHLLTAKHVWLAASNNAASVFIGALPDCDGALAAELVQMHPSRDAAILRVIDWQTPDGVPAPTLAEAYEPLNGRGVELHAMTPTHGMVMVAPNYSISSYDNAFEEYEMTPEVARGNSGGAIVHADRVVGLISSRAENEPIARALAMHSLMAWMSSVIPGIAGAAPSRAGTSTADDLPLPAMDSERGVAGLSHRLGSIHLHVDGARARDFVQDLVSRHQRAGQDAELAWVVDACAGPQRGELEPIYKLHNPGQQGMDELDYFSTTQLHAGPDLPTQAQRRAIAMDVHKTLCALDGLSDSAANVVIELERVVGVVDELGQVALADQLAMRGSSASLDAMAALRLFAPFNTRKVRPPGTASYELHFSLDLPRSGARPPVALEDLCEITRRAGVELGGWFLFRDDQRWAWRSNGFVPSVSEMALQSRWRRLRTQLDADGNAALHGARLRLLAEETLTVWRTPLLLAADGLRTVSAMADWEQNIPDLQEFWVLLPNFLGDQNEDVRVAMLSNLNRGVHYVYFLRSNADARRWLDFRAEMLKENDAAQRLMTAYVVAFTAPGPWDQLAAFVANPRQANAEGFELRIDAATNQVLYGDTLQAARIAAIVDAHSRAMGGDAITAWQLVQDSQIDETIMAVCANLLHEPSDELFARLDGQLALIASQCGGSVEVYGNRSITLVFRGNRAVLGRAVQFMSRALDECLPLMGGDEPIVLRLGLVCGAARLTTRACGMLWAGPAVRSCRRLLDLAPQRSGAFAGADASGNLPPFDASVRLAALDGGVHEITSFTARVA